MNEAEVNEVELMKSLLSDAEFKSVLEFMRDKLGGAPIHKAGAVAVLMLENANLHNAAEALAVALLSNSIIRTLATMTAVKKSLGGVLGCDSTEEPAAGATAQLSEQLRALNAQVTHLQERCTALLEEKRRAYIDYAVREFHLKFGHPAPTELAVPPEKVVRFRGRIITEEYLELINALFKAPTMRPWVLDEIKQKLDWIINNAIVDVDMVGFADGTHDLDYVVAGTRVAFGYDGLPGALEVHRANMDKEPAGGDKKPTKPPGWKPPDIERCLRDQGWVKQ